MNSRDIKNKKLRRLLDDAGLKDVILAKGDGYFWVTSDNPDVFEKYHLERSCVIYVNSFKFQTPEQWLEDIKNVIAQ